MCCQLLNTLLSVWSPHYEAEIRKVERILIFHQDTKYMEH